MRNKMKRQIVVREHDNATIEAIRAAVDKMVEEIGFDSMTIRDICAEVGITVGTFYHYFSSKNDLLLDRYIRYVNFFEDYYENELREINEIDALKLIVKKQLEYGSKRVFKIYKRYYQIMIDESDRWAEYKTNTVPVLIENIIKSGQEKGLITKDFSSREIKSLILSIMDGLPRQYFTGDKTVLSDPEIIRIIERSIDSFAV